MRDFFSVKILKILWYVLATFIIVSAILISIARVITPTLKQYQPMILADVAETIGYPVSVGSLEANWYGLWPAIQLNQVDVLSTDKTQKILHIERIYVGVNILSTFYSHELKTTKLILTGSNIDIWQNEKNEYYLGGQNGILVYPSTTATRFDPIQFLFNQKEISLENFHIKWQKANQALREFSISNITLLNETYRHRLFGAVTFGQNESTSIDFIINLHGNWQNPKTWKAKLFLHGSGVNLKDILAGRNFYGLQVLGGLADFSLWATWDQGWRHIQTDVNLSQPQWLFPAQKAIFALQQLQGRFAIDMDNSNGNWIVAGDRILIQFIDHVWPQTAFTVTSQIKPQNTLNTNTQEKPAIDRDIIIKLGFLDLKDLSAVATKLSSVPDQIKSLIQTYQPTGKVNYLKAQLSLHDQDITNWSITTQFDQIHTLPNGNIPGFSGLSGIVNMDQTHGDAMISSKNFSIKFLELFRHPITFVKFFSQIYWKKNQDAWLIHGIPIIAENNDALIGALLSLKIPNNNQSAEIQLVAKANANDIVNAGLYLPISQIPKSLINWLDQALVSGDNATATLILRGSLQDFPYLNHTGRFLIESDLSNVTLNYYPKWPKIDNLDGHLTFDTNSMHITANTGHLYNSQIASINADIENLAGTNTWLTVTGEANGPAQDGLKFLQDSPLHNTLGSSIDKLTASGQLKTTIKLDIPLDTQNPNDKIKIQGDAYLQNSKVALADWNILLNNISGHINFTENSLISDKILTELWGFPTTIQFVTKPTTGNDSQIQLNVAGRMSSAMLQKQFKLDFLQWLSFTGTTNYNALVELGAKSDHNINVTSDLVGMNVNLPAPLGKTSNTVLPFSLILNLSEKAFTNLRIIYGNKLSAALSFQTVNQTRQLNSGEITLNSPNAAFQQQRGLIISGTLTGFSWETWKNYYNSFGSSKKSNTNASSPSNSLMQQIRQIDLMVPSYNFGDLLLPQFRLIMNRLAQNWEVTVQSDPLSGSLVIPHDYPRSPVVANFSKILLDKNTLGSVTKSPTATNFSPSKIPPLNLTSNNTRFGDIQLGRLQLQVNPIGHGLNINRFSSDTGNLNILAQGSWLEQSGQNTTTVQGQMSSTNLAKALKDWGLPGDIESNDAKATFNLVWHGAPYQFDKKSLQGKISLHFGDGRIVGIGNKASLAAGLGQLLNLFSIQELPRHLRFGFSDMTQQGYAFDNMKGDFVLSNGQAETTNAQFTGPLADVGLNGKIGYVDKSFDIDIAVSPELTSSLPIVAAIAGGPIAGVATWAAEQIISPGIKKVTTFRYHATGSWDAPKLNPVNGKS